MTTQQTELPVAGVTLLDGATGVDAEDTPDPTGPSRLQSVVSDVAEVTARV